MEKKICIMNWQGHCEDENRQGCDGCDYYQVDKNIKDSCDI